jgi:hypothetical protein
MATNAANMEPVNEDLAHSYLKGMIERERVSFQEQKKHYESSKHCLSQAEDEFQSWMIKECKRKRNDSRDLVTVGCILKTKPLLVCPRARESPTYFGEDDRSCSNSAMSRNRRRLNNIEDHEIMRKISKQLMRGDAMMRRLSSMGTEHDELINLAENRRRASMCTSSFQLQPSNVMSGSP